MRTIVIARFNHETNTFSPVPTRLEDFHPQWGEDALRDQDGARTAMGAFLDIARALPDVEIVTPVAAMAFPSGTVDADAFQRISDAIVDAVAAGCDAIMLDLHGAMVAVGAADAEGALLSRIRCVAPTTPMCVALDLHGNVTSEMVENANIIVSFKTYPHVDMYETGAHAGRLLVELLEGRSKPVTGWHQLPLLSHTLLSNTTTDSAMQRAVNAARAAEQEEGVLAASVLAGFSLADFKDAGVSVVVVAEGDVNKAEAVARRIASQIWQERDGFVYASQALAQAMERARQLAAGPGVGPVLLLDHSDNVMSGGSCDTMDVLQAALEAGLSNIVAGPICDSGAVARLVEAGAGARVSLPVGNCTQLLAQGITKTPVMLTGVVKAIGSGEFVVRGPIYTGSTLRMGRTVLFDIGPAQLVLTEERVEPYDLGVYTSIGIDPAAQAFLLLKSRMYCRPVFGPISRGMVECDSDSGGPTSSNYALFPFAHLRRPVFPLDELDSKLAT